jgi:hypothetical protein
MANFITGAYNIEHLDRSLLCKLRAAINGDWQLANYFNYHLEETKLIDRERRSR